MKVGAAAQQHGLHIGKLEPHFIGFHSISQGPSEQQLGICYKIDSHDEQPWGSM
jgi:hypothetical protein